MPDQELSGYEMAEFLVEEEDLEASTRSVVQTDLPILLVGLGGVGTCAVAHLLRRVGGLDRNPNISAICIDTTSLTDHETRGRMPWIRSVLTEGSTFVSLTDSAQFAGGLPLREWRNAQMERDAYDAQFGWYRGVRIPDALQQFGAGAIRQVGRLVFARAIQDGWLRAKVTAAMSKLTNARPGGTIVDGDDAGALVTIVVAGTAGGTGSGMFLDTVALLHDIRRTMTVHQLYVRGLLAAPTIFLRCNPATARLAENAYALFKELDYAMRTNTPEALRQVLLPAPLINMPPDMDGKAFLSNVYVVDDKIPGVRNVGSVAELHAVMGQSLYALTASVAGGAMEASDQVNGAGSLTGRAGHRTAYSTIGSSRALVPVDSLATHCAQRLIVDIIMERLLVRPDGLEAALDRDFDKKGSLTLVYDNLCTPVREMEKAAQRLTAKVTASANAVDTADMTQGQELVVALRRTRDQLNRQKTEGLDSLRRELSDVSVRGVVAADAVFREFINGCDQGLVYAEEAVKRLDTRLENDLSTMRMQVKNLRPKPNPETGEVRTRSMQLEDDAARAGRGISGVLGRLTHGSGSRQLAEDFVKAVSDEIVNDIKIVLLEAQANYVAAVAAAALVQGPARNDVAVEATERAESVVREAKKVLRARAEEYQGRVKTFRIQQSEGGISVTTDVYPLGVRAGLTDGHKLSQWYDDNVRRIGGVDGLEELAGQVLQRLRAGEYGLYSWGLKEGASETRARARLLAAAVDVVTPLVKAGVPDSIFSATGEKPVDTVRSLVVRAAPTVEANTPEHPIHSSTACVSDPSVVGESRQIDNATVVAGGTVYEALALRCVHGHVLDDFPRVREWRTKYKEYLDRADSEEAMPLHLADAFVRLPEPVVVKTDEQPDEVFETFLFAMLATELAKTTLASVTPKAIKLRVAGDESQPVETLADLPSLVRLDPDSEKGWVLAPLDRDNKRGWVVLDRSADDTVLGPHMTEVIGVLAALPTGRRDAVREVYKALLSQCPDGTEVTLAAMKAVRTQVLKRMEADDSHRMVWQRIARELAEEIAYCESR